MHIRPDELANRSEDILGRSALAKEIADGIKLYSKKQKSGITLSITGEWGSGKSTLIQFLLEEFIGFEQQFKVITFNPWMFYKNESIRQAFLIELALVLKDYETSRTQVSKKLKDLVKAFGWIKNVSAVAGNIQEGIGQVVDFFAEGDSVGEIKNEIEKILFKSKRKILVVIDDVDRLMPDQIMEVFQTISLIADFSNIIYVLAFDKKIVIDSISNFFTGKGEDYLEKIIQIDYEIPKILDEKLNQIFLQSIAQIEHSFKIKLDEYSVKSLWDFHGLKHYFKSVRDFKRFFNSFAFRLPVIADEVNVTDFLVIEAIRIFDYQAYENLYIFYTSNLRRRDLSNDILNELQFSRFTSPTSDLLKAIFPKSTIGEFRKESKLKRLHDPAYFERYFSLIKTSADISEKDLREIIQRPAARKGLLREALNYGRIENLVKRLADRDLIKHYPKYDYTLIKDLVIFFNENPSLFEEHAVKASGMIISLLCVPPQRNELIKAFFKEFGIAFRPVSIVYIYFFHWMRLFIKNGEQFQVEFPIFDKYYKNHYGYIESTYIDHFRAALNETIFQSFTEEAPFIKYLYQINFAQLFPTDYPQYFDAVVKGADYAIYMAEQCMMISTNDNRLMQYRDIKELGIYPDKCFLTLYEAVKKINNETLSERQKIIKQYFLAIDISEFPQIKYPAI